MKTLAHQHDKAEIVRRVRSVRPDSDRCWGQMSAHQMICHLSDSCRVATGEKVASDASGLLQRTLVKWIALHLPLQWPPGIPTRPEVDQQFGGTRPGEFASDVAELEGLLEFLARREGFDWPAHPIFGRMSRAAWLRWGYLHADHHLRQFGA
jgi:uncharacterized protein DUF1569